MNEMLSLEKQKTQSGQATLEYVLLLAIVVALILGLANQLIKPFGNWMQDYMGQYLECLIDMGELPSVGGSGASGECNSKFSSFSVTGGRPPLNANGPNGQGPQGNRGRSQANSRNGTRDAAETSSDGGGAGGGGGGGSSSRGRNKGFPVGAQGGADTPNSGMPEGTVVEKLPSSKFFKTRNSGGSTTLATNRSTGGGEVQIIPMSQTRRSEKGKTGSTSIKSETLDESSAKGKKLIVKPTERKIAEAEEEAPWSFSQYIKYAVILAIIVALVLFIGGQIAQITKSMEK